MNKNSVDRSDEESDVESDNSEILPRSRKRVRRLVISDDDEPSGRTCSFQEEWIWEEIDNVPEIKKFVEVPGINALVLRKLGTNPNSLEVFEEALCKNFWQMLSTETNRYAEQVINNGHCDSKKIDTEWFPVTVDEMKAYFALCIIMSQIKKSEISMYWSKRSIIHTPIFSKTMPRRRFVSISRFLHFTNNEKQDKNDKLNKIRNIVNYLNDKFTKLYTPKNKVSIDESLMKYKGRLSFIQFIATKRARFGIKFYKLCESESGYCSLFKIYVGQDKVDDMPASESVVMELSKNILGKGYTLYLDNWYSSPNLYQKLLMNDTNVVGTVRKNRKNMPKGLPTYKMKKGEVRSFSSRGLLALRWRDKKDVYMLSTKHSNADILDTGKKRKRKDAVVENVLKPNCVIEYNDGMGGVDKHDQQLACFPVMRKCVKGYRKMFFYMFDIALYNTYVLFNKINNSKTGIGSFRLNVAEEILNTVRLPTYKPRGRPSCGDAPYRLEAKRWRHFPEHIRETQNKKKPTKRCRVCYNNNIRSETTWQCKQCQIPLHLPKCFEKYHTFENY